jgi:TPP-dependent pyruvate/acetoin dehydrogenase alpha subunit
VVGGNLSVAAGVALAMKLDGRNGIVAVLFGDGAAGSGTLHETLNIAALWKLPLLFVCNNNQYSVSTPRRSGLAPAKISDIGTSFGLPSETVDGMAVATVTAALAQAAGHVRSGEGPAFVECVSIRLLSHSTTARETRSRDELRQLWQQCPIARHIAALNLSEREADALRREAEQEVIHAIDFAERSSFPDASQVLDHVS